MVSGLSYTPPPAEPIVPGVDEIRRALIRSGFVSNPCGISPTADKQPMRRDLQTRCSNSFIDSHIDDLFETSVNTLATIPYFTNA